MDLSSGGIEDLLNKNNKKISFTRLFVITSILAIGYVYWEKHEDWIIYVTVSACLVLVIFVYFNDKSRKVTTLDEKINPRFSNIQATFEAMSKCSRIWSIVDSKKISDTKNNAGSNVGISRQKIKLKKKNPPYIKSSITPLCIPLGKNVIYFYPNHVLIASKNKILVKNYLIVTSVFDKIKYVEDESVPKDANIVGTTWQYVNKNGNRDKRYKDNKELPIVEYAQIEFKSMFSTLGEIQVSRINVAESFCDAIKFNVS